MARGWRNWAGNARCVPARVVRPRTEAQLVDAVTAASAAGQRLRVVGAGHSFTPVACTDGTMVDLRDYRAVLAADRETGLVTVQAGIPLWRLNAELAAHGLALPNLGDITYQTVAGAISTATHGTGARLGNLSTAVAGLRLVTADGTVLDCSADRNADVFAAARVGVGALGVISTVTLQTVPAFTLHAVEEARPVDGLLARLDELVDGNDHFEFFWFPGTDHALAKRNNRIHEAPGAPGPRGRVSAFVGDVVLSNVVFGGICRASVAWPPASALIRAVVPRLGRTEYSDASHRVFATTRLVRFVEMEYAVPRPAFPEVFERVRRLADPLASRVVFPVECRWVAGDDIPLSPASGRDTAYLAVHVVRGNPYEDYFRAVEAIMDSVGGRPHWGKLHYQSADVLAGRYPRWAEFQAVRKTVDPSGSFTNDHVERVLGPTPG